MTFKNLMDVFSAENKIVSISRNSDLMTFYYGDPDKITADCRIGWVLDCKVVGFSILNDHTISVDIDV